MDTNVMTTLKPTDPTCPADLVDRDILAAAAEHLAARAEALARAEAAHAVERQKLEVSLETSELAVAGQGGDPLEAALKVEEASRRERVAAKVLAHAADAHRRATEDHRIAGALALKPVHRAWRLRRLAASRKGDLADAAKSEAMREYAEATAEMLKLTHAGLPDWHDALAGPVIYRGEADEVKHWADRGLSGDDLHPWTPGRAE